MLYRSDVHSAGLHSSECPSRTENTDGDSNSYAYAHDYQNANRNCDSDSHGYPHGDRHSNPDASDPNSNRIGNPDSDANADDHGHCDGDSDCDTYFDHHAHGDGDSNRYADFDPDVDCDGYGDAYHDSHSDRDFNPNCDPDGDLVAYANGNADRRVDHSAVSAIPDAVVKRSQRMNKLILIAAVLLLVATSARAQDRPLPTQTSITYEASHIFTGGVKLSTICVNWHTQAARWLMLFDRLTVPSNGAVTPEWCLPVSAATTPADQGVCFDWTFHPVLNRTGVTFVVSTNAGGCTTLTADGANDWFTAQVQ